MRLIILTQGPYGERIARNIENRAPSDWTITEIVLPKALPPLIDEPDEFLPSSIPEADLIIATGESPGAAQLIIDVVELSGARAVVAPIDNSAWLQSGLANQLKRELAEKNVAAVFPKPFCSLTESSYDYGRSAQQYNNDLISAFAHYFGRPGVIITGNPDTKLIEHVEVTRSSACGSAYYVAERLVGISADEASIKAGLILHHFPCLCSMQKEQIDDRLYDTIMHVSGYIMNEEVLEQVKPYQSPTPYITPSEYVE